MTFFAQKPEVQAEIDKLIPLLKTLSVDGLLAYETATALIGRDVTAAGRYSLQRAREIVEKEDGVRFATVHGVGVKRLAAKDIPALGGYALRHMNRTAKKTVKQLSDLRAYNDMEPGDRLRIVGLRLVASHIVEKTDRKAVKEVEDNVRQAGSAIDFGNVLKR